MDVDAATNGPRLSAFGQTYVASVAVLALITTLADSVVWFAALALLTIPLSLLAVWVVFYAGLAVGFVAGHGQESYPWAVALVWVLVWAMTAWLNAHIAEKIVRRGWDALRVGPRAPSDD